MIRSFVITFFMLLGFHILNSQETLMLKNEILTKKNGLSDNYISGGITEDKYGFIWIGTTYGLCRYDGINFDTYLPNPFDSMSLKDQIIREIYCDKQKNIWVKGNHLSRYDYANDNFQSFLIPSVKSPQSSIMGMFEDPAGNIWFQMNYDIDGIIKFDIQTKTFSNLNVYAGKYINQETDYKNFQIIEIDSANNIWVSTENNQKQFSILKIDMNDATENKVKWFKNVSQRNVVGSYAFRIFPIKIDSVHRMLTSYGDYLQYDPQSNTFISNKHDLPRIISLESKNIRKIILDRNYRIWLISYTDGSFIYKDQKLYSIKDQLSHLSTTSIFEDKKGLIWIGSMNGLNKLNLKTKKFNTITKYNTIGDKLIDNYIHSIAEQDNNLWVSTSKGLSMVDKKTKSASNFTQKHQHIMVLNYYNSMVQYKDNTILCGSSGLNKLHLDNHIYEYSLPIPDDPHTLNTWTIWKIHRGKVSGNYWIATQNGFCRLIDQPSNYTFGVSKKMPEKFERILYTPYSLNDETTVCFDIYEDNKGIVWAGTKKGLWSYEPTTKKLINYFPQKSNPFSINASTVSCIYEDSRGVLWVGTEGGGLNYFDRNLERFYHYTTIDGLSGNMVWGILEDENKNLWISTNNGLTKYNPNANTFTNFDEHDGLTDSEFLRGAYMKSKDGQLYFGTAEGIVYFNPKEIQLNADYPEIVIHKLWAFGKLVNPNDTINEEVILSKSLSETSMLILSHQNNNISIGFTALHFVAPKKNKYQYKLDGFDKEWINTDAKNRQAHYNNLPSGKYIFKVRASNNDGIWNPNEKTLRITILYPFWERWWFILFLIIFSIFFIWLIGNFIFIRYRKTQLQRAVEIKTAELNKQKNELEKLNNTKDKFLYIIGHDLKNPFQAINGMSELLQKTYDITPDEQKKMMIGVIEKASKSATELLENLLLWSKMQTGAILFSPSVFDIYYPMIESINLIRAHSDRKKIIIFNRIDQRTMVFADKNMIEIVLRNLLSNAVKFTPENGQIKILTKESPMSIEFSVEDTGIGMTEEVLNNIFKIGSQFNTRGTEGESGTGIGLALCKEFLEMNGSELRYESEPGKGSRFSFILRK